MADKTSIEWCDSTLNPWVGCTKVSAACDHCYAEGWAKRSGMVEWGNAPRRRTKTWNNPLKWQRDADAFEAEHGRRRRVFCASLADVFDNQVPPEWRADLWDLIRQCDRLDWLLLTKRPQNIRKMLPPDWGDGWAHVWLGTTAEDQTEAVRRIPHLLAAPAAIRFLSAEPLLGPIDFRPFGLGVHHHPDNDPSDHAVQAVVRAARRLVGGPQLDWIIVGGESGPQHRPMQPEWARSIRDQCEAAGVPFFMKQLSGRNQKQIGDINQFPADLRIREWPNA